MNGEMPMKISHKQILRMYTMLHQLLEVSEKINISEAARSNIHSFLSEIYRQQSNELIDIMDVENE
jgi:hypothetical protein